MDLIYLAHPLRPPPGSTETVESNLRDAEWWLTNLQRANPGVAIIAPWILELRLGIGDEAVPEDRVRGLARCREAAAACDAILLCGPRIGSGSLSETMAHADDHSGWAARRRVPVIHRFRDRDQDLVLPPRHRMVFCDFADITPVWLRRCLFGACPQSVELVGAEILAAIEREAVRS